MLTTINSTLLSTIWTCASVQNCLIGCSNNVTICEWPNRYRWDRYCERTCGTSQIIRFCCEQSWIRDHTCAEKCNKNYNGYDDEKKCGEICFHGGTLVGNGYWDLKCQCRGRYYGVCCEQRLPSCDTSTADVIFVLDSSISQSEKQFNKQLDFVSKFIEEIKIGPEDFQIGVVTFSWTAVVEIYPRDSMTKDQLRRKVRQVEFRPGATYTHTGLQKALEMQSSESRRPGMDTDTYVIVLTDGMSSNRQQTAVYAKTLKQSVYQVIAIGVGQEVSHKELQIIASPPDEYSSSYVFSIGNFDALNTLIHRLVDSTCNKYVKKDMSDIIFLIDGNTSRITPAEFQMSIDTASYIVKDMNKVGLQDGHRVGIAMVGRSEERILLLSNDYSKDQLLARLQTLQMDHENACYNAQCPGSLNITGNIQDLIQHQYTSVFGGRDNARKFLLVFSSGRFDDKEIIRTEMMSLVGISNVTVFAIGVGENVDMEGVLSLVTEPSHVYVALNNEDMSNLDVLQSRFSYVEKRKS